MAAPPDLYGLEDMVKCSVCLDTYQDPKLLSCFHTFCEACLRKLRLTLGGITCPLCKAYTCLPLIGTKGLKSDFKSHKLMEIVNQQQMVRDIEERKMEVSEEADVGARTCDIDLCDEEANYCCLECKISLCKSCQNRHSHRKYITEIQGHVFCGSHPERFINLYCYTCERTLCSICAHAHDDVHKTVTAKHWIEYLRRIRKFSKFLSQSLPALQQREEELEILKGLHDNLWKKTLNTVTEATQDMLNKIKVMEEQCLRDLDAIFSESERELISNNSLSASCDEIEQIISKLVTALNGSPKDCIAIEIPQKATLREQIKGKLVKPIPSKLEIQMTLSGQVGSVTDKLADDMTSLVMEYGRRLDIRASSIRSDSVVEPEEAVRYTVRKTLAKRLRKYEERPWRLHSDLSTSTPCLH